MRKLLTIFLVMCLLAGCTAVRQPQLQSYNASFLELFDTVTTVVGQSVSREEFEENVQSIYTELKNYHQLFDIYHSYEGMNNLKTVNDNAGVAPVQVDPIILDFLEDCKQYYLLTDGKVNIAMGGVLKLWHQAREQANDDPAEASLPDSEQLLQAAAHTDIDALVIDRQSSTVYLTDEKVQLDVGAVAKGWATQRVAENAAKGMLISVGGNVCATGAKQEPDVPWVIGIQDPDGGDYLHTLNVLDGSVVTSGDYQRFFMVGGKTYHHIIDPQTLMPGTYWRSVTVICRDSGLADALSTALFLLPLEEGKRLLAEAGAEAMWVDVKRNIYYSQGFEEQIRT